MRQGWRRLVWSGALLVASGEAARPVHSQTSGATHDWSVVRDPFADLWFQTIAETGFDGAGPLPLYARGETSTRRTARPGSSLGSRLALDSAFEVLHFVPLYFGAASPTDALDALSAAGDGATRIQTPAFAAARLIAEALPSRPERDVFRAIVANAKAGLGGDADTRHAVGRSLRALDSAWQSGFVPALRPLLAALGIVGGTIVVSDPVGADGRFMRHPGGLVSIVVGRIPESRDTLAPLLAAVRELAFPLIRSAAVPTTNERTSGIAATRAGALLLDALAPQLADRYRRAFTAAAVGGANRSFDDLFFVDVAQEHALRAAVASVARLHLQPHTQ